MSVTMRARPAGPSLTPILVLVSCLFLGFLIPAAMDLPLKFQVALMAMIVGGLVLAMVPNRRILLVAAWVLVHPLSIEKIVSVGTPLHPEFFPPSLVISASDIVLGLLLLSLLMEAVLHRNREWWRWPPAATPLFLLVAWTVVAFFAKRPDETSLLALVHWIKMLIFVLVVTLSVRIRQEYVVLLVAVLTAVAIQACLTDGSFVTAKTFSVSNRVDTQLMGFTGQAGSTQLRASGTLGHANQEASFLTFFSLVSLGLAGARNGFWRWATLAVAAASLLAIGLTFSRSAWMASLVAIVVVNWLVVRRASVGAAYWGAFLAAVLLIPLLGAVSYSAVANRLMYGDEGATDSRKRLISLSVDMAASDPIMGVGPGNFARATMELFPSDKTSPSWLGPSQEMPEMSHKFGRLEVSATRLKNEERYVPLPVHNKYMLILSELGSVGLVLFLWFQWRLLRQAMRCLKCRDGVLFSSAIGVVGAWWASQVCMGFELYSDDKSVEILLFVAVAASALYNVVTAPGAAGETGT